MRSAVSWLERRHEVSDPRVRVYCFPHAGGSASFYADWPRMLAPQVETVLIQLPGRGRLLDEPVCRSVAEAADAIAAQIAGADLPVILLGNSMGAILAFEVATRLEAARQALLHLIVTARPAPSIPSPERPVSTASRDELVSVLREYDATPAEVFGDAELLDFILPVIRADFHLIERYRCAPDRRVAVPVTAFGGTDDPGVPPTALRAWRRHTSGEFSAYLRPGGHFVVTTHQQEILDLIRELARTVSAS